MRNVRTDRLELDCDVLVVGGGFGGARAALRAAELGVRVILVEKAVVSRAGPSTYVHSQYAPDRRVEGDELEAWMEEFVVGANYLADQDWVRQYILEAYDRTQEMIAWKVPYARDAGGALRYVKVRGHRLGTTLGTYIIIAAIFLFIPDSVFLLSHDCLSFQSDGPKIFCTLSISSSCDLIAKIARYMPI